ncbi:MAG: BatA domain-containing protein [Phycisphaerales bacterium JB043]
MAFVHPLLAILGIASVAIPIAIHLLLRRKRKPVMFGAMRFVVEAYRQQRSRIRLEQLLLLFLRCLVILLIALAIARPLLSSGSALAPASERSVYILLDTSVASSARIDGDRSAMDAIKNAVETLLDSLRETDKAALVTLDSPSQGVVVPPTRDIETIRTLVSQSASTQSGADLQDALRIVLDDMRTSPSAETQQTLIVLASTQFVSAIDLSDPFPSGFASFPDTTFVILDPEIQSIPNTQITSVRPLRAMLLTGEDQLIGGGQVSLSLRRTGGAERDDSVTTLRVWVERERLTQSPATASVRWQPGQQEAIVTLQLPSQEFAREHNDTTIVAEIDRDALEDDNIRRAPLPVRQVISVGVLTRRQFGSTGSVGELGADEWLRFSLVPSSNSPIDVRQIDPSTVDSSVLSGLDVALLPRPDLVDEQGWSRLRRFVDAGGMLMVMPPEQHDVHLWSDAIVDAFELDTRFARESSIFESSRGVSTTQSQSRTLALLQGELQTLLQPVRVHKVLPIVDNQSQATPILTLDDNSPWLVRLDVSPDEQEDGTPPSLGSLLYLSSSTHLSWTNLPAMPLMVPLMQEIVRQGVDSGRDAQTIIAGQAPVITSDSHRLVARTPVSAIAEQRADRPVRNSGVYTVEDDLGDAQAILVVNTDTDGSLTTRVEDEEISKWISDSGIDPSSIQRLAHNEQDTRERIDTQTQESSSTLSITLLMCALLTALIETLLARLFSHATIGESRSTPVREVAS